MAKNKKFYYFALFFSQTELPWGTPCHAPLWGGERGPTDGLREIHFILYFIAGLHVIH